MSWEQDVLARLERLIEHGTIQVLGTRHSSSYGNDYLDHGTFFGWRTQVLAALRALLNENHTYSQEFDRLVQSARPEDAQAGLSILHSIKIDVRNGYLRKVENLISADLFADFLQMAQHLLDHQYKDPAASLCGAVLENGLRRIAGHHDLKVTDSDDLSSLRDKCAQAGVFNKMVRQQIVSWTTLRNHADHGQFDQYTVQHVASMIQEVRNFLTIHLD